MTCSVKPCLGLKRNHMTAEDLEPAHAKQEGVLGIAGKSRYITRHGVLFNISSTITICYTRLGFHQVRFAMLFPPRYPDPRIHSHLKPLTQPLHGPPLPQSFSAFRARFTRQWVRHSGVGTEGSPERESGSLQSSSVASCLMVIQC